MVPVLVLDDHRTQDGRELSGATTKRVRKEGSTLTLLPDSKFALTRLKQRENIPYQFQVVCAEHLGHCSSGEKCARDCHQTTRFSTVE